MTSKIKVDNINKVSDDSNIIKKCGTTTTIGSGASNPIVVDGSAITLGRCGGTVALASGATQTGFGRTGTVDWQTGSIKTGTFTAANGEGYFVNTSGGVSTANLPAGSAGAIVSFSDYTRTFGSNSFTISPNGSEKIGGVATDLILNVNGQALTLVYVDGTEGWINVQNAEDTEAPSAFICASVSGTCNTLVTAPDCANTKIATFKGPGTFTVNSISTTPANNEISYLVVAGGGGGGYEGAAGAGGYREVKTPVTPYTASPLCGYGTPGNRVSVTAQGYAIVVGGGGNGTTQNAPTVNTGNNSSGFGITSAGGGAGKNAGTPTQQANGGSGGGGASSGPLSGGGTGNTPPTTPSQGFPGGTYQPAGNPAAARNTGGGGGGATARGGGLACTDSGTGGAGAGTAINTAVGVPGPSGPLRYFAGGGGGGVDSPGVAPGGIGGGGAGNPGPSSNGVNGTVNTGGGGGGSWPQTGGNGGSGIVVIRYKFQ
jgi:hypothetical protein